MKELRGEQTFGTIHSLLLTPRHIVASRTSTLQGLCERLCRIRRLSKLPEKISSHSFEQQVNTPRRFAMEMGNARTRDTDSDETRAMAKSEHMETATCSKSGEVVSAQIAKALPMMKDLVGKMQMVPATPPGLRVIVFVTLPSKTALPPPGVSATCRAFTLLATSIMSCGRNCCSSPWLDMLQ